VNQSHCDRHNNKAGSPLRTRGHAATRPRPPRRSFTRSPDAASPRSGPGHPRPAAAALGTGQAPGEGYFLPLVPEGRGDLKGGVRGCLIRRGVARLLRSSRAMRWDSGVGACAPRGASSRGARGVLCTQPGADSSPPGEISHSRAFAPHGVKAGVRRTNTFTWAAQPGTHPPEASGCGSLSPSPHRSTHPAPGLPSRLFEQGSAWKGTNPRDAVVCPAADGDSAQEPDLHGGDARQCFSYTFSPFSYWFHNTPASLLPLRLSPRLQRSQLGAGKGSRLLPRRDISVNMSAFG